MKKIPSLFKRNYSGNRQVYNEIVPGTEWVLNREGVGTVKFDGTPCLIVSKQPIELFHIQIFKRYNAKNGRKIPYYFTPCEEKRDPITGHWHGWIPIKSGAEDKPFWEAVSFLSTEQRENGGTFELVGPKIQGNPYNLTLHLLRKHGSICGIPPLGSFNEVKNFFLTFKDEGIVWHHPDGKMAKIKRRDFGFEWPVNSDGDIA